MGRTPPAPKLIVRAKQGQAFGRRLRAWYRRSARDLPWRRTRDAYHVLVSELMLQQTQVARVVPKYGEFLDRFPTLAAVARASPAQVSEAWAGLGYYARARNLHALAQHVTCETEAPANRFGTQASARRPGPAVAATLPADPDELRALPGIGRYTAGAVASFAYERSAALVDTNVARVLTRVFAPHLDGRTAAGRRAAWTLAERILPRTGRAAWVHNQALIELGALVCTARVAHCDQCPVRSLCRTGRSRTA
jgi:A/G-specific adenine glycosylase